MEGGERTQLSPSRTNPPLRMGEPHTALESKNGKQLWLAGEAAHLSRL